MLCYDYLRFFKITNVRTFPTNNTPQAIIKMIPQTGNAVGMA